jgi:hypothetical protein
MQDAIGALCYYLVPSSIYKDISFDWRHRAGGPRLMEELKALIQRVERMSRDAVQPLSGRRGWFS